MMRALAALVPAIAFAAPAGAQDTPATARCRNEALPFPATDANRLTDEQLRALFTGKNFVYVRESTRVQGAFVRLGRELRADGSMVSTCQLGRNRAGPWKNCQTYGSDNQRIAGNRDVGACFAIHRQGGALAAKNTRGPRHYCGEGPITVE